jgi:hypothetical protein
MAPVDDTVEHPDASPESIPSVLCDERGRTLFDLILGAIRRPRPIQLSDNDIGKRRAAEERELRRHFPDEPPVDIDDRRADAEAGYGAQDARVARFEQRANIVAGSVTLVATATTAASGLLLGSSKIESLWGKLLVGCWAVPTVFAFLLSGLYALQVSMPDHFSRPHAPGTLAEQMGKPTGTFQLDSLAALLEATKWNQAVADCKNRRLQRAVRCYRAGTLLLGGLVIVVVVLALAL